MTVYRARMDGFVFWMTTSILALLGFIVFVILTARTTRAGGTLVNVGTVAATISTLGIAVYAYVYTPKAFHLGEGVLRIERPASDVTIPLASVSRVKPLDVFLGLSLKAFPGGNSGFFGIYGTFHRKDIGKYQLYGRAANQAVLLETSTGTVVVTPARRDEFIAAVPKEIEV